MCKVMILKGIQDSKLALDFMKAVAPNMSLFNSDGIGYSAVNSQNKMFMEKWHYNKQFLDTDTVIDAETLKMLEPFKNKLPYVQQNYTNYGDVTRDDLRTVTMHTRYATCGKTFENTHPFIEGNTSLIHNGVIRNADALNLNKNSTCDSENALQLYKNLNINLETSPDNVQSFIDKLKGYWAFAFLSPDANDRYMLDVVREGASLYWALLPELGEHCAVIATTQEIIEIGVRELGLEPRAEIVLLSESNYHRFDAVTGEFIDNFILDESELNKIVVYTNKYPPRSHYIDYDSYESYETYKSKEFIDKETKTFDDIGFDSFFDTNEPLIDRLSDYDKMFNTAYLDTYEDIPRVTRLFIDRRESEEYITFDDVLKLIEAFQENESTSELLAEYRKLKRA